MTGFIKTNGVVKGKPGTEISPDQEDATRTRTTLHNRVDTIVKDVASWHRNSSQDASSIDDVLSKTIFPDETVVASIPTVAIIGFPKLGGNRFGKGKVVLVSKTGPISGKEVDEEPAESSTKRRFIFISESSTSEYNGIESARGNLGDSCQ